MTDLELAVAEVRRLKRMLVEAEAVVTQLTPMMAPRLKPHRGISFGGRCTDNDCGCHLSPHLFENGF